MSLFLYIVVVLISTLQAVDEQDGESLIMKPELSP